ncbi:MAG: aminotransferase class I/II-fold pyridoxal phosphate-dependent enzyme, partial [Armatimonadetes bacterium]|nr:aminotransferase class I/II-fold pyridoxal phosphate-dependent enzyme [Armatimonadota bacterium]MDW8123088.1 aminotransferase class I/II-fold pyridoxal phosphate-dependent enzyme [Armatimonadota bacterium]
GDIAPLPEIVSLAQEYEAMVMVDDAHGEGVLGRGGRGITDHFHLHGQVDVEVGTLSKAFGVVGGYVAGGKELGDYLRQRGRPFLFSSAVTPADVAACIAAVDALLASEDRVQKLWENARFFQGRLKEMGLNIGRTQTPITPLILGEAQLAQEFSRRLFEAGVFAQAIGYPTVPKGAARIRMMLSAVHSRQDLEFALSVIADVAKSLKVLP